ncbi:hypothetical protein CAPTEDRAFT_90095, partial [Capitella teleta]
GTPLLSELMYMVFTNADITAAKKTLHGVRVRFMEHTRPGFDPIEKLKAMEPPRLLKSHLPATFFRSQLAIPEVKVVVMIRDPRDVLVSFYKFYTADSGYVKFPGDWSDFFSQFKAKKLMGGDWFEHTKSWLEKRDQANVMIMFYEDVITQPEVFLRRVAEFCSRSLTDLEFRRAAEYLKNEVEEESTVGAWKEYFSAEQDQYFTELYKQEIAEGVLPYS